MSEESKSASREMPTEQEMFRMARDANRVQRQIPSTELEICGKKWQLRPITMKQGAEIANYAFDAVEIQDAVKQEGLSAEEMKRLNIKLRKLPAKMAAHYVLGRLRWFKPFAFARMWRKIWNQPEEVSATINTTKALGRAEETFYTANLQCLVNQLALSMRQVGESVKKMQERKESAESMLEEDASPKKEEGSKSAVPSKRPRTTKR